jgi:hypothetical protein
MAGAVALGHGGGHAAGDHMATGDHGAGGHDKIILQRSAPEDRAKAARILQAAMEFTRGLGMHNTEPAEASKPDGDHRRIPLAVRRAFEEATGLKSPGMIVIDRKSGMAIGALFSNGQRGFDLGMGTSHKHKADGNAMQHVWFAPDNLDLAFSDVTQKPAAMAAARASL